MFALTFETSKTALITGASRGIGRTCALKLARAGVPVAINFRRSAEEACAVVREIERFGGRGMAIQADVSKLHEAHSLIDRVENSLGPLGVLVNNAGVTKDRLLLQMTEEEWDFTWKTDLNGPRTTARQALTRMVERGYGRIINVGSVVGTVGSAGQANYAAAKSALNGMTRDLAVLAAPFAVTVNCVVPGYVQTDATSHLTESQQEAWVRRIPMNRTALVDEVVDVILFLASCQASYLTGQCIAVDGGFLANASFGIVP
jgi:NAD(P)-dependent dehydrogenase (short-subunit alcohol dehydrogenase family)